MRLISLKRRPDQGFSPVGQGFSTCCSWSGYNFRRDTMIGSIQDVIAYVKDYQPAGPVPQPVGPTPLGDRPNLDDIRAQYQVQSDEMVDWKPSLVGWFVDSQRVTAAEAELLDNLQNQRGLIGLNTFKDIRDDALQVAQERYPDQSQVDSHADAFRHAYWSARLTSEYGVEFAEAFGTAHEANPGNTANAEAMDLYNNEVGRRIATENPDASPEELADLVQQAVENGEMLVIGSDGELAWSDQVQMGNAGRDTSDPLDGGMAVPDGDQRPESGY